MSYRTSRYEFTILIIQDTDWGPRIGIYVGEGASHSWTWFVDLLEKFRYRRLSFLDEESFIRGAGLQDVVLLSGGDTFGVARALGQDGAAALRAFVEQGGLYIGSCAGAYLPLYSSKEPLCEFNFVRAKINNLARDLPPVRALPGKFSTAYGCSYIIHPVREEVRVRLSAEISMGGGREIRVPLYGGPPLQPSEDAEPWAWYSGFTERTLFLTDAAVAEKVYLGKVAACEKRLGRGRMVLLGPHFEHPAFPDGNEVIRYWLKKQAECRAGGCSREEGPADVWTHPRRGRPAGHVPGSERLPTRDTPGVRVASEALNELDRTHGCLSPRGLRALKTEVSNMRIRANALARESVSWRIGQKVYEPEKAAHFVDTIWKRLKHMRAAGEAAGAERDAEVRSENERLEEALLSGASGCHQQIRRVSEGIAQGEETETAAEEMFKSLRGLTAAFLEMYFTWPAPARAAPQGKG